MAQLKNRAAEMLEKNPNSILWLTNPLAIVRHLPLELPDFQAAIVKRLERLLICEMDENERRCEYFRCKNSCTYYLENYGYLYNPLRPPPHDRLAWQMLGYQREYVEYLVDAIKRCNGLGDYERENIALEKCRETAGSFSTVGVFKWDWQFNNGSYLILSRKEEEVDEPGNMDTPFEKIRYMLRLDPPWLLPPGFDWKKHSHVRRLVNPNGGIIGGEAFTEHAGAGGRVKAVLFDEFARTIPGKDYSAWRSCSLTTNLRIAVSTAEGPNNKFAELCGVKAKPDQEEEEVTKISFHWWKDPRKMQGAQLIDNEITSQWQREAKRTMDAQTYASQVLIDFNESRKGKVYEEYKLIHKSSVLVPVLGVPIIWGVDPGVHFFLLATQILDCGCYLCLQELYFENADIDKVAFKLNEINNSDYRGYQVEFAGDPSGSIITKSTQKMKSEYMHLYQMHGINVEYAYMYQIPRAEWITAGIQAGRSKMTRLCDRHQRPQLVVNSTKCRILDDALGGKYRYKNTPSGDILDIIDEQHPTEDAADSFKYPLLYRGAYTLRGDRKPLQRRTKSGVKWSSPSTHGR